MTHDVNEALRHVTEHQEAMRRAAARARAARPTPLAPSRPLLAVARALHGVADRIDRAGRPDRASVLTAVARGELDVERALRLI